MPPSFADFSKSVTDILSDDFESRKYVKSKFSTPSVFGGSGITVTSETDLSKFSGKLSAKWKHSCGFSVDKVAADAKSMKYEASLAKLAFAPGVTLKCAGLLDLANPLKSIDVEYRADGLTAIATTDAQLSKPKASVTMGVDGLLVGGAVNLSGKNGLALDDCPVSVGYSTADYFAAISAQTMFSKFGLAAHYKVSDVMTVAFNGSSNLDMAKGSPNCCELGAVYQVNPVTVAKCKFSYADGSSNVNPGTLEAAVSTKPVKKVSVACAFSMPLADAGKGDFSYGLGITLG